MHFLPLTLLALLVATSTPIYAQRTPAWRVQGDTTGAPAGCSAAEGIAALDLFVDAVNRADSSALVRALALRRPLGYVFSMGKGFRASDTFFVGRALPDLLRYARQRSRNHERITLQAVTFNGWHGRALHFGPVYFQRSANDLGAGPRDGIGKGGFECGLGLAVLNLAPRPPLRSGQRMRYDQRLP